MQYRFSSSRGRGGTYPSRGAVFGISALAMLLMMHAPVLSAPSTPAGDGDGNAVTEQEGSVAMVQQGHAGRGGAPILGRLAGHFLGQRSILTEEVPAVPQADAAEPMGDTGTSSEPPGGAQTAPLWHHHRGWHERHRHSGHHHFHGGYATAGQFAVPLGNQGYSAPAYLGHGRVATTVRTAPWEPHVDGGSVVGPPPVANYERHDGRRAVVSPPIVRRVHYRYFHKHW